MKNISLFLATSLLCIFTGSGPVYAANYGDMLATPSFIEIWEGKNIQAKPESGAAPLRVLFEPFFPEDRVRQGLKFEWVFGDGQSSTERTPVHVYTSPGVYDVKFKRYQQGGEDYVVENHKRILVTNGENIAPKVEIKKLSISFAPGEKVMLDASTTKDEDGVIRSYQWTQYLEEKHKEVELSGAQSAHASFLMPESAPKGKLHFELKVEDDQGALAYRSIIVLIRDSVKIIVNNPSDFAPFETNFRLEMNSRHKIVRYAIDYEGDGIDDTNSEYADGFNHLYTTPGVYHPVATLTDEMGARYTGITTIEVLSREDEEESIRKRYQLMSKAALENNTNLAMGYFTDQARPGIAGMMAAMDPQHRSAIFSKRVKRVNIYEWYGGYARVYISFHDPESALLPILEMVRSSDGVWYFNNLGSIPPRGAD